VPSSCPRVTLPAVLALAACQHAPLPSRPLPVPQLRSRGATLPSLAVVGKGERKNLQLPPELEDTVSFHPWLRYPVGQGGWMCVALNLCCNRNHALPVCPSAAQHQRGYLPVCGSSSQPTKGCPVASSCCVRQRNNSKEVSVPASHKHYLNQCLAGLLGASGIVHWAGPCLWHACLLRIAPELHPHRLARGVRAHRGGAAPVGHVHLPGVSRTS
jgi:hypothetical protein